jgi:serine/threonine-protein phosphatase PGAM5
MTKQSCLFGATERTMFMAAACIALASSLVWSAEVPQKTNGVRTVYLIRHGQYDHDDPRDPDVGKGLVPLGVAQAKLTAARLKGLPGEMSTLQSSTMTRARETALVIGEEFPELDLQTSRLIRECLPPNRRIDIMERIPAEALQACTQQLEEAFKLIFTPSPDADRNDIVVCHGNVIRYFVTRVLGVDTTSWLGMSIANCSLTIVKVLPNGSMKLLSFSDAGHIPPNLTTRTFPSEPVTLDVPGEVAQEAPEKAAAVP